MRAARLWSAWRIAPVLALLVVVAAAFGVLRFAERADDTRQAQVLITQVEAAANRQSAIEWQAAAEGGVSAELRESAELAASQALAARRGLDRLPSVGAEIGPISATLDEFQAAVRLQLTLAAQGRTEEAEEVDEARVDPAYADLLALLAGTRARYAANASDARSATTTGMLGALGAAALIVALLFWRYMVARRRTASAVGGQRALRASEERFRALVQNSTDVITVIDAAGLIRYESAAVAGVLGHAEDALLGTPFTALVHPDDTVVLLHALEEAGRGGGSTTVEFRMRHHDGSWRETETILTDLNHEPGVDGFVLNTRDITERKALQEQLAHQAFHDSLTGLANRSLFGDRVSHALRRRPEQDRVAVLFIDLDDFKTVNDSLGHPAGDALIVRVAEVLRRCVRPADTVARLGGDEFAVLLEDFGAGEPRRVSDRILKALQEPVSISGEEVSARASIGIAIHDQGQSESELLRNADMAMYTAKGRGKSCSIAYEPAMHELLIDRVQLSTDLRQAIRREEFVVHYQPLVDLDSTRIVGVEALARWAHPRRGLLAPAEFITIAEETGLIVPLGRLVLREACRQARAWHEEYPDAPPLPMNVNLSERQLKDPGLVRDVRAILDETGLRPELLVLELTEGALIGETDSTVEHLRALKTLGIKLAIDDFGMGYSSLSYLQRLPVDKLKIDKSFVDDVTRGGRPAALAETIIDLGRMFGLETVAEGIEHSEQVGPLRALGCRVGQGFHFARPVDAKGMSALLGGGLRPGNAPIPSENGEPSPVSSLTAATTVDDADGPKGAAGAQRRHAGGREA